MKKINLLNKSAILLVAASLTVTALAGCQNKSSQQTANTNSVAAQNSNNNANGGNNASGSNAENRKKRMQDSLSSLVSDKTINQTQADKILEALTSNTQGFNGQRNRQNNGQSNNQSTGQNATQNSQQNSTQGSQQNSTQPNVQNGQRFSPLSKLVQDGVITQAQADTVMQKLRGNFSRPQNNQNQTQSQNQSSNQ